jgi:hypothetical protein
MDQKRSSGYFQPPSCIKSRWLPLTGNFAANFPDTFDEDGLFSVLWALSVFAMHLLGIADSFPDDTITNFLLLYVRDTLYQLWCGSAYMLTL